MPLTHAQHGMENTIIRITGRDEVRRLLQSMGFVPGEKITVVNQLGGNIILGIKNSRVALDRALAQRIIV